MKTTYDIRKKNSTAVAHRKIRHHGQIGVELHAAVMVDTAHDVAVDTEGHHEFP